MCKCLFNVQMCKCVNVQMVAFTCTLPQMQQEKATICTFSHSHILTFSHSHILTFSHLHINPILLPYANNNWKI